MKAMLVIAGILLSAFWAGNSVSSLFPVAVIFQTQSSFSGLNPQECTIVRKGEKCVQTAADGICCIRKTKK